MQEPNFDDVNTAIEAVREVDDSLERATLAHAAHKRLAELQTEFTQIRREAIEDLDARGVKHKVIADALEVTVSRVGQLVKTGPAPERAFFGAKGKPIIVAFAEKVEAKTDPGPVTSTFDVDAYEQLRALVSDLGLTSEYEYVKAPERDIHLNRDGLVVVCGPRHSSLIEHVLASDNNLGFAKEDTGKPDTGWHLVDKNTGKTFWSPVDRTPKGEREAKGCGDVAYLGRLPRPDGKGHFLYFAGIHAAGAAGVVRYLTNELPALYREVRNNKRFSVLVECTYDKHNKITSAKAVTPIYKQEG